MGEGFRYRTGLITRKRRKLKAQNLYGNQRNLLRLSYGRSVEILFGGGKTPSGE
jgi:hypothetical protein